MRERDSVYMSMCVCEREREKKRVGERQYDGKYYPDIFYIICIIDGEKDVL